MTANRRRVIAGLLAAAAQAVLAQEPGSLGFRVFDGLLHRGKPDLTRYGLEPIRPVANIWRPGRPRDDIDDSGVIVALTAVPRSTRTIYLDIESWPLYGVDPAVRDASMAKMLRVVELTRRVWPQVKFGFYGAPPVRVYWPIIRHDASYRQWLMTDRVLAPLAQSVDYIFPSLYTFYADPTGWLRFAEAQLNEARQYQKPVYPFLWYKYHNSNRTLGGHELAGEAWEQELRFCRAHADGVVLWGGAGEAWDETAAWWQAARRALALLHR